MAGKFGASLLSYFYLGPGFILLFGTAVERRHTENVIEFISRQSRAANASIYHRTLSAQLLRSAINRMPKRAPLADFFGLTS